MDGRIKNKTESDEAIEKILADAQARSGRQCKVLRTDGDGIFGRSKSFQELQKKLNFVHERPAPYDHEQSALSIGSADPTRSTATLLIQSGAPSNFWGLANNHYVFTRNVTPRHEKKINRRKFFISSNDFLEGRAQSSFNLTNLVAFGTQATCFIPPARREGKKTPGQKKSFDGVVVGFVNDMRAYKIWDLEKRKIREVSFNFEVLRVRSPSETKRTGPQAREKYLFVFSHLRDIFGSTRVEIV